MTISSDDKILLQKAGFTYAEIDKLDSATDPSGKLQPQTDIATPAWQSAIQHREKFAKQARIAYANTHKGEELTRERYDRIVDATFRGDIFGWLKITYQPKKKTDFYTALQARMQEKEARLRKRFRT